MLTLLTLYLAGVLVMVFELQDLKEEEKIKINYKSISITQFITIICTSWFGWAIYKTFFTKNKKDLNISIEE